MVTDAPAMNRPVPFVKSRASAANGACVEVQRLRSGRVRLRDSKFVHRSELGSTVQPVITLSASSWDAFLRGCRSPTPVAVNREVVTTVGSDGAVTVRSVITGVELTFLAAEWRAFLAGVERGEFDRQSVGL